MMKIYGFLVLLGYTASCSAMFSDEQVKDLVERCTWGAITVGVRDGAISPNQLCSYDKRLFDRVGYKGTLFQNLMHSAVEHLTDLQPGDAEVCCVVPGLKHSELSQRLTDCVEHLVIGDKISHSQEALDTFVDDDEKKKSKALYQEILRVKQDFDASVTRMQTGSYNQEYLESLASLLSRDSGYKLYFLPYVSFRQKLHLAQAAEQLSSRKTGQKDKKRLAALSAELYHEAQQSMHPVEFHVLCNSAGYTLGACTAVGGLLVVAWKYWGTRSQCKDEQANDQQETVPSEAT